MNTIRPNNTKLAIALTGLAGMSIATSAVLAEYTGDSWYPHPRITADWQCAETINATMFSAQNCIVDYGGQRRQAAVVVRNRDQKVGHAAKVDATFELKENLPPDYVDRFTDGEFTCRRSGVGAKDYSVCFSPMIPGEGYLTVHSTVETDYSNFSPDDI